MIRFILNNEEICTSEAEGLPILDFIRYHKSLYGTKIGCREGDCGACTILVGELSNGSVTYRSATSCLMPIGNATGKHIVTIEGINMNELNPIQQAMNIEGATQCGFCTPGFVVSLAGFCLNEKEPSGENAIHAVNGNLCRCTGYKSIERAALRVAGTMQGRNDNDPVDYVTANAILPEYFKGIRGKLLNISTNGQVKDGGRDKKFLGGGTDLYVQQHEAMVHSDIEFLFDVEDLRGISVSGNKCMIGASATVTDLLESPVIRKHFHQIDKFIKLISSTQIRNMATVAGNFINASPIGDLTIIFLALDAMLVLNDGKKTRELSLRKLYKGYKDLDKSAEEFIEKIWFELPTKDTRFNFEKVSKRTHLDIASVNTAICITNNNGVISSASISAGGVGPIPMYLQRSSEYLSGKMISDDVVDEVIKIAQGEISPISDARGSEEYKRLLLGQLIKAHFA